MVLLTIGQQGWILQRIERDGETLVIAPATALHDGYSLRFVKDKRPHNSLQRLPRLYVADISISGSTS
ncbi:hypothetical protein M3J09_011914 [Ascochyta lentis]